MGSNDGLDCRETSDSIEGRGQVTRTGGILDKSNPVESVTDSTGTAFAVIQT